MDVAVTGGSGFLGQHVVRQLVNGGHRVKIIDVVAPRTGTANGAVGFAYDDLEDPNSLRQAFKGVEAVMHLAAVSNTNVAYQRPGRCMEVNGLGTQNVFIAAKQSEVDRVIVASSSLVSGALTQDKPGAKFLDEEAPFDLSWVTHPYVMSKIHVEMIANVWQELYGVPATVLRYGIQYGRNMAPGVVAHNFITRAVAGLPLHVHGDGKQWRQYTHVDDIAAAHVVLVKDGLKPDHVGTFNVVGDDKVTIGEMADIVASLSDSVVEHGPPRSDDITVKMLSNAKAKKVLGWKPTIGLAEGLEDAFNWYRENPTAWTGPDRVVAASGR